ncbi:Unknown protein [Striga hermonthica]|uniref:Organ specific protein n=1 Tax=Striga hermonthica TaxID=68872 RepID=A0A9N7NFM2_STRHE|nr:Unknown protein [Striga hermonthica]
MSTFFLLSFVLFAYVASARKDPGGEYWNQVMKGEPMPKTIADLLQPNPSTDSTSRTRARFVRNFDTSPNLIIYHSHHHFHLQPSAP